MQDGKKIEVISFGTRWGLYPGAPDDETLQHVIDVRGMMDDPEQNPRFSAVHGCHGCEPELQNTLSDEPEVEEWLLDLHARIRTMVQELDDRRGFQRLRLYFHCRGGRQRSVFVAETVGAWLREERSPEYTVTVAHLSLAHHLARFPQTGDTQ